MFPCLQSCKSLKKEILVSFSSLVGEKERWGQLWCLLHCCDGQDSPSHTGNYLGAPWAQGQQAREAELFTSGTSTLMGVRQGWPLHSYFWDSHHFSKCQKNPHLCISSRGIIVWDTRAPTAGVGASAWSGERLCLVRQTGVKQVAREAEQTPIEFSQSHITPNGSGSSPLHHSPVSEISWLLLALDESICQPHKSPVL